MFNSFNSFTIWLVIILCLIAAVVTYRVLKEEERKQKTYEQSGESAEEELERSLEYEKSSWKTNISSLNWMYIVAIVVSLVAFLIYMYTV